MGVSSGRLDTSSAWWEVRKRACVFARLVELGLSVGLVCAADAMGIVA